jgi:hypothetical protein
VGGRKSGMKIVIQCAATKRPSAGCLITRDDQPVEFVAHPELAPAEPTKIYARPDDISDRGISWREQLRKYNENQSTNPLGLVPSYQLYENNIYGSLVDCFGIENVYILSAGWGLIRSDFLTPYYDITFSQSDDFRMLPDDTNEQIIFIGGKDYLPLFCGLTRWIRGERTTFFNSKKTPDFKDCVFNRFDTKTSIAAPNRWFCLRSIAVLCTGATLILYDISIWAIPALMAITFLISRLGSSAFRLSAAASPNC